ncbi:nickel pincer cofactor biosynthesis protein LarB [Smaragdicoccus niigatensis]|uniref:nickel pincer cofactor biosynthesis protein LarB n=1 Tax=Smaragdicoccus niigatensis TaxID=359359 RepID=UPI00036E8803|nr:nickel pincer cofactor biosynthesis protein LarB [Smaragdicoccus niigatensis]
MTPDVILDFERTRRIGISEAVLCDPKTDAQIVSVLEKADAACRAMLLTRLDADRFERLPADFRDRMDYEELSRTAFFGAPTALSTTAHVAVVTGGTSDIPVAREVVRTLAFHGHRADETYDVGVAGLWRIQQHVAEIATHQVVIAVAGMDAALPTVLAGLVPGVIIAVPTSVGYGVSAGGTTALHSVLASCAPGLVVVNIDNGYGAACAAMRSLR